MQNDSPSPGPNPFSGRRFHRLCTTCGAWLYGDERGYRTRRHREHVDGDYKNPPPDRRDLRRSLASLNSLKQAPVGIPSAWQEQIDDSLRGKLVEKRAFVLCLVVSGQHVHALVKYRYGDHPRMLMGLARKNATFEAHERGWKGRLWGRLGKELPIRDQQRQIKDYRDILAHKSHGAWDWMKVREGEEIA